MKGKEVARFRNELDNLVSRFFDLDFPSSREWFSDAPWSPKVDVADGKKKITVKAELPGEDIKDIDVSLDGRILAIKGEKKQYRARSKSKRDNAD